MIDNYFYHWLAGFTDGEGSFGIYKHGKYDLYFCTFGITLRADDLEILEYAQRITKLGVVFTGAGNSDVSKNASPVAKWAVRSKIDCLGIVRIFDEYPLRAKKKNDYAIWRLAVMDWNTERWKHEHSHGAMAEYAKQLRELRIARKREANSVKIFTKTSRQAIYASLDLSLLDE